MTNIVTVSNGTFFTTASAEEIEGQITRGMQWLTLRPSGSLLNLAHVVSIEDDSAGREATANEINVLALPEVPAGPAQGGLWPC